MKFKVTAHKAPPPDNRSGITEQLRALQVNYSLHVPADPPVDPARQRKRLDSLVQSLRQREGLLYKVRKSVKGGFDIYRVETPQ